MLLGYVKKKIQNNKELLWLKMFENANMHKTKLKKVKKNSIFMLSTKNLFSASVAICFIFSFLCFTLDIEIDCVDTMDDTI